VHEAISASVPPVSQLAAALGFRRIERVRVVVRAAGTTAEATGVVHRYPRTVQISLAAAARLIAAGAPLQIDRPEDQRRLIVDAHRSVTAQEVP
jgi:hypothetical protein